MNSVLSRLKLSSLQLIIAGFLIVILTGTLLLMLPASSKAGVWTSFGDALFTSVSAVCVTGLVITDTASFWSAFGQAVILVLIQIGGLSIVLVTAFFATISGKKISLLQRSMLQDSISSHQIGGVVKMTSFIFKTALLIEACGILLMLPSFCKEYGVSGIWMSVFHAVSAFCNAGFDIMGTRTGAFTSLTAFGGRIGIVLPVCFMIVSGGIGFFTWKDIVTHKLRVKKYHMQSKVILVTTAVLILLPTLFLFFREYSLFPAKERICLSLFQAVTPRTAGFNTADLTALTGISRILLIILMLIGGSPGSTAGGIKTTTLAVLCKNSLAVIRQRKSTQLFGRRITDDTIKVAATLLMLYLFLTFTGAFIISMTESLPVESCLFETASAIGTVGLSLGITPLLGPVSRFILLVLMFFGRVGGLTLLYAAISSKDAEVSRRPIEKITVG
ncbi:MAG: Trk family potassium uptake protein [Eubacterium sp.]|nr:Trk family potassium uptake protein [Eubacterium sp.]